MKTRNVRNTALVAGGMALTAAGASHAALDFTAVTGAIDVTAVVAALTAIAALKIAPGFTKWAYNKVIGWFRG